MATMQRRDVWPEGITLLERTERKLILKLGEQGQLCIEEHAVDPDDERWHVKRMLLQDMVNDPEYGYIVDRIRHAFKACEGVNQIRSFLEVMDSDDVEVILDEYISEAEDEDVEEDDDEEDDDTDIIVNKVIERYEDVDSEGKEFLSSPAAVEAAEAVTA